MTINTKEQLKSHIHNVHNFLRNSGGGYNKEALKFFMVFYGFKVIEPCLEAFGLDDSFRFSQLVDAAVKDSKSCESAFIRTEVRRMLLVIRNDDKYVDLKNIIFHPIPLDLQEKIYIQMVLYVNEITVRSNSGNSIDPSFDVDLAGKVYEYFIGRDQTAISDLGAYFTNRHITDFTVYRKLRPVLNADGSVPTFIDPFGGSGGCGTSYVKYLNQQYPGLDWKKNINNIFYQDADRDSVKIAALELMALTGCIPSVGKRHDNSNFISGNSFAQHLVDSKDNVRKFKYIFSNPPYGGDDNNKTSERKDYEEIIEDNDKDIEQIVTPLAKKELCEEYKTLKRKLTSHLKKIDNLTDLEKDLSTLRTRLFPLIASASDKDNLNKIFYLSFQNKCLKSKIEDLKKEETEKTVNFSTCSKYIQDFCKHIVGQYTNDHLDKIINYIDTFEHEDKDKMYLLDQKQKFLKEKEKLSKLLDTQLDTSKFNDKEACSLVLFMSLLDADGTCAVVLKEGVLFDNSYSMVRGYLIDNFNVTDIISIPQDQFENTYTKTSIVVFHNTGKTKVVRFTELKLTKKEKTVFVFNPKTKEKEITERKDTVENVYEEYQTTATYEQLSQVKLTRNKNGEPQLSIDWSLNYKNYMEKKKLKVKPGFEIKKLIEVSAVNPKRDILSKDVYYYLEIGDINKNSITTWNLKNKEEIPNGSKRLVKPGDILIGSVRSNSDKIVYMTDCKETTISSGALFIIENKDWLKQIYTYTYMVTQLDEYFRFIGDGSNYPRIKPEIIADLLIPFPTEETLNTVLKPHLKNLHALHTKLWTEQELLPKREKEICELIKTLTNSGQKGVDWDEYKLGEVYEVNPTDYTLVPGETYEYLDISNCQSLTLEKYKKENLPSRARRTIKHHDIIMSSVRPANKNIAIIPNYFNEKRTLVSTGYYVFRSKDSLLHGHYLFYYLINDNSVKYFVDKAVGALYPSVNNETINSFTVRILKPHVMEKYKLEEAFAEVEELRNSIQETLKVQEASTREIMKLVLDDSNEKPVQEIQVKY